LTYDKKLVKDIPGARVGLEFEMIVPGAVVNDDGDREPDYDYDERARSFGGIEDFFMGGDGNNSRRDVRSMIEELREEYDDWAMEQRSDQWYQEGRPFFDDYASDEFDTDDALAEAAEEVATEFPELDKNSDEFNEKVSELVQTKKEEWLDAEWYNRGRLFDQARESWEEDADWPDEDDWLESQGYRYMSDLEQLGNRHDVYWPHYTSPADSETDIEGVASDFEAAVGRPVKYSSSYHSIDRDRQAPEGFYILEPDGSLDPNDMAGEAGLEFVSPPLPVDQMIDEIRKVAVWAKERGAYTGKGNKTGLHMNVSVPGYSKDKLDYVKLALLLGDNHILSEFDRVSYTYARSSFDLLSGKLKSNPEIAERALTAMKGHFDMAASKAIHGGSTDKYTSINVKENRVEFRGPGGDYLGLFAKNPNKLFAPLMRFVVALEAACDPTKYRDEYQKKLYKFLNKNVKGKGDELELFSNWASGKGMPQSAFKSVLKQRKAERVVKKQGPGKEDPNAPTLNGRPSNPDGNYVLYTKVEDNTNVLYRFTAADHDDAFIVLNQWRNAYGDDPRVYISADRAKALGQPGQRADYAVYRKDDGRQMKVNGEYVVFKNTTQYDANRQLLALLDSHGLASRASKYEVRPVVVQNQAQATPTAQEPVGDINLFPEIEPTAPVPGSTADRQQRRAQGEFTGAWRVVDDSTGQELYRFSGVGNSQSDANRVAAQWLRDNGPKGADMSDVGVYPIMGDD